MTTIPKQHLGIFIEGLKQFPKAENYEKAFEMVNVRYGKEAVRELAEAVVADGIAEKEELEELMEKYIPQTHALGVDYGLILNVNGKMICTTDGAEVNPQLKSPTCLRDVLIDGDTLLYAQGYKLKKWPDEQVHYYDTWVHGIGKHHGDIIVTTRNEGGILNEHGTFLFSGLEQPWNVCSFKGKLYHTESGKRGLVRTPHQPLHTTGAWANGLVASDDRLFFGGQDRKIYSYDGDKFEVICEAPFRIHCIEYAAGVIYAGGFEACGILVVPLDNPMERKVIFSDKTLSVRSIATAPLDLIHELKRTKLGKN